MGLEMNVLVTGRGTSGSWAIRGRQLGEAIGATIDIKVEKPVAFDMAVIVKRIRSDVLQRLREKKIPIVWDVVDAWPQPYGNEWDRHMCIGWLRSEVSRLNPTALVVSTQLMEEDCAEFKLPTLVLPHHSRPNQRTNPIREHVERVGYEGGEHYLGKWRELIDRECKTMSWQFMLNPIRLCDVDIILGLRDCKGYAARNWKSNVKLANAQGSGTPCIMNRERGYMETAKLGVAWADDEVELMLSFKVLTSYRMRKAAADNLLHSQVPLQEVADKYKAWLQTI